jgi:23S rRNA (cytosine1962-C5)-methyltransferase
VEDAFKFVQREVRRGKTYHGILLDPPAYGRGPDGEKWLLEKQLNELMQMCGQILEPNGFMLLNLYSMGFSAMVAENLVRKHVSCQGVKSMNSGELFLKDQAGNALPLGTFVRL